MSGNQSALMGGDRPPVSIVNAWSAGGVACVPVASFVGNKASASGALTANVLKTMLNISGAGVLKVAAVYSADTTARTMRLKITLDGTASFDAICAACTTSTGTQVGVGSLALFNNATPTYMLLPERIPFNSSCLVEIASSLSETDKVYLLHAYETI